MTVARPAPTLYYCRMVNDASRIVKAQDEDPGGPDDAAVMAGWARAEASLYGPLLADPQAYERVVTLVGAVVTHLREAVGDVPGLIAASRRGAELAGEVAPDAALPWVPLDAAVRAACAMRHRELLMIEEQENRRERLAEGLASGAPWVRIIDPGSSAVAAVAPALLVHLASGMAIRCTTEMDEATGGARFVSSPVVADPSTGDVTGSLERVGGPRSAASLAQREEDVRALQDLIERLDSQGRVG